MYYYLYCGYLAMRYSYILDYGYMTLHYGNMARHWIFNKSSTERSDEIDEDWVLCNNNEPDVIIMN